MTPTPTSTPPPAPLTPGQPVWFEGGEATIVKVHDAAGPLDLIRYAPDAGPRFYGGVAWGHGIGQWIRIEEHEAGRPKTPLELVALALSRGEKAPVVGAWVAYSHDYSNDHRIVDVRRVRARVRTVISGFR